MEGTRIQCMIEHSIIIARTVINMCSSQAALWTATACELELQTGSRGPRLTLLLPSSCPSIPSPTTGTVRTVKRCPAAKFPVPHPSSQCLPAQTSPPTKPRQFDRCQLEATVLGFDALQPHCMLQRRQGLYSPNPGWVPLFLLLWEIWQGGY